MAESTYLWDFANDSYLAETDLSGVVTAAYTVDPSGDGRVISQLRGGTELYYQYDGFGNSRQVTDASGEITDVADYDAFGNFVSKSGESVIPFRWVGEQGYYWDSDVPGYYIRARAYEPALGRWCSVDPLTANLHGLIEQSKDSLQPILVMLRHITPSVLVALYPYSYCRNAPTRYTDPSGLAEGDDEDQGGPKYRYPPPKYRPYPHWNITPERWEDDFSEGWNVDSLLNPQNAPIESARCGESSGSYNIAVTVVRENSVALTREGIENQIRSTMLSGLPIRWDSFAECKPGQKCCTLLKASLNIRMRSRVNITVPTFLGAVVVVVDVTVTIVRNNVFAVCVPTYCPCPPELPEIRISSDEDYTNTPVPLIYPLFQ